MLKSLLPLVLFLLCGVGSTSPACADYYRYTDASGAVNMTNKLDAVPKRYRSHVEVIKDDTPTKRDAGGAIKQQAAPEEEPAPAPQAAAPAPASVPEGRFAELCARFVWLKPLLYVIGVFAGFLVVVKAAAAVPSALLSRLIYLAFFIGVFTFVYKAYVEHVVNDSIAVKEKAVNMMKKANQREIPLPGEEPQKQ